LTPSPRVTTERPRSISSALLASANRLTDIAILKDFNTDIFYFAERQDLRSVALSIQSEIASHSLNKPRLRGYSTVTEIKKFDGTCQWSHIRYEQGEENAARKLKFIVKKVAPKQKWKLLALPEKLVDRSTPGYISIFVEDEASFRSAYSIYHQEQGTIIQEANVCEQQLRE
jgi:hypothetical protein